MTKGKSPHTEPRKTESRETGKDVGYEPIDFEQYDTVQSFIHEPLAVVARLLTIKSKVMQRPYSRGFLYKDQIKIIERLRRLERKYISKISLKNVPPEHRAVWAQKIESAIIEQLADEFKPRVYETLSENPEKIQDLIDEFMAKIKAGVLERNKEYIPDLGQIFVECRVKFRKLAVEKICETIKEMSVVLKKEFNLKPRRLSREERAMSEYLYNHFIMYWPKDIPKPDPKEIDKELSGFYSNLFHPYYVFAKVENVDKVVEFGQIYHELMQGRMYDSRKVAKLLEHPDAIEQEVNRVVASKSKVAGMVIPNGNKKMFGTWIPVEGPVTVGHELVHFFLGKLNSRYYANEFMVEYLSSLAYAMRYPRMFERNYLELEQYVRTKHPNAEQNLKNLYLRSSRTHQTYQTLNNFENPYNLADLAAMQAYRKYNGEVDFLRNEFIRVLWTAMEIY